MSCVRGDRRRRPVSQSARSGSGSSQHSLQRVELGLASEAGEPGAPRSRRSAGRSRGCRDEWRETGAAGGAVVERSGLTAFWSWHEASVILTRPRPLSARAARSLAHNSRAADQPAGIGPRPGRSARSVCWAALRCSICCSTCPTATSTAANGQRFAGREAGQGGDPGCARSCGTTRRRAATSLGGSS